MYEEEINSAKKKMTTASILKLAWIALMVFWAANAYSNFHENMLRLSLGKINLPIILGGALLSALMSILWLVKPIFHTLHLIVYLPFGFIYYFILVTDLLNATGIGAFAAFIVFCPCLFFIGLIPFLIYISGRKAYKNALFKEEAGESTETQT